MSTLIVILLVFCAFALIYWFRQRDERAYALALEHCKRLDLQFISIARHKTVLRRHQGFFFITSIYQLEFSGDNFHLSQGQLVMYALNRYQFELPAYPIAS